MLRNKNGFTLLEMLVVIAILSIFLVLLIETQLSVKHRFDVEEIQLTLVAEARDFIEQLHQDVQSGAVFSKEPLRLDQGKNYIDLEIPVADNVTGIVSGKEKSRIVYYVPADNRAVLLRTVLSSNASVDPYMRKTITRHLKSITVEQIRADLNPLLNIKIELEKTIPDYPPVTCSFTYKMKVYL